MKRLVLLLICLVLGGCRQAPAPSEVASATPEPARKTLVALGDSLTEGMGVEMEMAYPAQLEARFRQDGVPWKVVNAGLSGETSSGALSRLDWVLQTKPDAVLLETGANDGLRGVDPDITRKNLDSIITRLEEQKIKIMLLGMKAPSNLGESYTAEFARLYPAMAEKHDVPLIPFFLEGVARVPELNQEDGKHPTAEGYTRIVDNIYQPVKDWLENSP